MNWPALIVGLVALERLAELVYANRNTRTLVREGAYEIGRSHYKLIVLLHAAWLISVYLAAPPGAPAWTWIALFLLLQIARYWILATLGRYWTTRIIVVPNAPLIAGGPYRFLRHPNYAVVIAEIVVLPLAFREYGIAIVFSLLNMALLWWRIRVETAALNKRH
ncbi:MAG TPA: isoprenylcysteine carboxylmethyltransferase family protein [Stellaceae bacterium]|jgi:methyltransferase|nr:isoprenylcysteine carboxylmethyltransferase family protein [Stellaceae bacterium]